MPLILPYKQTIPQIHDDAYIADNAVITGDVVIGADSNIWFGCTLRGDVNNIVIGARSNIQDHTMMHVSSFGHNTEIGDDVTVGHAALLHACKIGNGAFVGMQACVMDGAILEDRSMVAAGSLVTPGKVVPSGQLWSGSPARFMRDLTDKDFKHMQWSANHYVAMSKEYKNSQK